jgi:hypothetical protein
LADSPKKDESTMKKVLLFVFGISAAITACNEPKPNADELQSSTRNWHTNAAKAQKYRLEYVNNYDHIFVMDSTFHNAKGENIRLYYKQYCLFDSALHIPGKYIWEDSTASFITHNYAIDLVIVLGAADTLFSQTLTKDTFRSKLTDELLTYGTLLEPNNPEFDLPTGRLRFLASIGIPITPIGTSIKYNIGTDGKLEID